MLTHSNTQLMGTGSLTDAYASTIADAIIALRYVELGDAVPRALAVLKVRGSKHSKDIHKYIIDDSGMRIEGRLSGAALSAMQSGHEPLVPARTSRAPIRRAVRPPINWSPQRIPPYESLQRLAVISTVIIPRKSMTRWYDITASSLL